MFQKNFTFLLTTIILCIIGVSFFYGQVRANLQASGATISSVSINEVEKQTVIYKEKQVEINKTNSDIELAKGQIRDLQIKKLSLESELTNTQNQEQTIQKQITENKGKHGGQEG